MILNLHRHNKIFVCLIKKSYLCGENGATVHYPIEGCVA